MAGDMKQAALEQSPQELIKQLQAALAAKKQPAEAPAPTFSPGEEQQFARFGLDPRRLRFLRTLSDLRRGMNLDQELTDRAMKGTITPSSGGVMGEEELAQFA